MKLVYVWAEKYKKFLKQGFSFSNNLVFNFENEKLSLKMLSNKETLFHGKIKDVHLLLGKNGAGKTSILDLLGSYREHRNPQGSECYFMVYELGRNRFLVEGLDVSILQNSIENLPFNESIQKIFSIVVEWKKGKFFYLHFPNQLVENKNPANKLLYISYRDFYDGSNDAFGYSLLSEHKGDFIARKMLTKPNRINTILLDTLFELKYDKKTLKWKGIGDVTITLDSEYFFLKETNVEMFSIKSFKDPTESTLQFIKRKKRFNTKENFILNFMEQSTIKLAKGIYNIIYKNHPDLWARLISRVELISENPFLSDAPLNYYLEVSEILLVENLEFIEDDIITPCSVDEFKRHFLDFITILNNLPIKHFLSDSEMQFSFTKEFRDDRDEQNIKFLFQKIEQIRLSNDAFIQTVFEPFNQEISGISTGEMAILSLLSVINKELRTQHLQNIEGIILLLDEPERGLHPEWCRRFLSLIVDLINQSESSLYFQLVLSSHSPFLVSDLPNENILYLDNNYENTTKNLKTFAGNIHTLFNDSLFVDETIGEFSKTKINEVIKYILYIRDHGKEDEYYNYNIPEYMNDTYAQYVINLIGEPVLKNKIQQMYDRYILSSKTVNRQIEIYRQRIEELIKDDYNRSN